MNEKNVTSVKSMQLHTDTHTRIIMMNMWHNGQMIMLMNNKEIEKKNVEQSDWALCVFFVCLDLNESGGVNG